MIWTTIIFIVKSSRYGAFSFTVSWRDFARGTRGTFLGSWNRHSNRVYLFFFFMAKNWPLNAGCSAQQYSSS